MNSLKKYVILFALFCVTCTPQVFAQKVSITLTDIPTDSVKAYLEGFYGADKFSVDSFVLRDKVAYTACLPASRQGVYALHVTNGKDCLFVSVADSLIEIKNTYDEILGGTINTGNSADNEAFKLFLQYKKEFAYASDSLDELGRQLDEFDPYYDMHSKAIRNAYVQYCRAFNRRPETLTKNYPGTYTATVLARLIQVAVPDSTANPPKYDNPKSFNHHHFFSLMPLGNEGIISNPFFEDKIIDYLTFYTHRRDEKKLKKDLIYLEDSLSKNPAIKEFIRYAVLKHYLKNGPQEIVNFLTQKSAGEGCENSSPYQTNKSVKNLLAILPGKPAPQLALKDLSGSPRSLSGVTFGKKAVVIVFWASWCGHCRDSIPVFYQWYKQNRDKGLEVYSVSLDNEISEWAAFTETYTPDWINVSELKGWQGESVATYSILSTPTYIAVDENSNILLKTNYQQELQEKLLPVLNKKQK